MVINCSVYAKEYNKVSVNTIILAIAVYNNLQYTYSKEILDISIMRNERIDKRWFYNRVWYYHDS